MIKLNFKKAAVIGMCCTIISSGTVLAVPRSTSYEDKIIKDGTGIGIQVNGQWLQTDLEPFISNNSTLVPLRGVMEKLGAQVEWDPDQQMVKVYTDDVSIKLVIDEDIAKIIKNVDGIAKKEELKLEVPAKMMKGHTFIPGRFVAEALGAKVEWDPSLKSVIIRNEKNDDMIRVEEETDKIIKKEIQDLVEGFGNRLQMVSLMAPNDILKKSIEENYSDFVSPVLLARWQATPSNVPGRLTSSPWPDHIEVVNIKKLSEETYQVKGKIIEVTSVEKVNGGIAAKQSITLKVKSINEQWVIDDVTLDEDEKINSTIYENPQYGFNFQLPDSWKDYKILSEKWEGFAVDDSNSEKIVESGPMISIRHPQWTVEDKRQDIPIMIFTLEQWESLQQDEFHIGAAPIGPRELGRNSKYVFALPARYNYAFPEGYEEVEEILDSNSLTVFD